MLSTTYENLTSALRTERAAPERVGPGLQGGGEPGAGAPLSKAELRRRVRAAIVEASGLRGTAPAGARPEALFGVPPQQAPMTLERPVAIDPALARKLLAFNTHNRDIRPAVVEEYARLMLEGRWKLVSSGVSVTADGLTGNGQHRLIGLVAADATAEFVVNLGMPADSIYAEDRGKRRTLADDIGIAGLAPEFNPNQRTVLAAGGRLLYHLAAGRFPWVNVPVPTEAELRKLLSEHRGIKPMVGEYYSSCRNVGLAPAVAGAFFGLFAEADERKGEAFARRLVTNENLGVGTTLHTLHKICTGAGSRKFARNRFGQMVLLVRAWNNFRRGDEVSGLHAALRDGKFPQIEGLKYDRSGRLLPRG